MSERVLRSRVRNGPSAYTPSEYRENVGYRATPARRGRKRELAMARVTAASPAVEYLHLAEEQSVKKRVVFSSKRYTSDDLVANGHVPQQHVDNHATPVVGILKHATPPWPTTVADHDLIDRVVPVHADVDADAFSTPVKRAVVAASRSRKGAGRQQVRVSKHASFTEAPATDSPWRSASSSLLAALALSVSPVARKRAKLAERVAKKDETVRSTVDFYRSAGEWWNVFPKTDYTYSPMSRFHREISPGVMTLPNMSRPGLHSTPAADFRHIAEVHSSFPTSDSDSDELDDPRSNHFSVRRPHSELQHHNSFTRIYLILMTSVISIFTFLSATVRSTIGRASAFIRPRKKTTHFHGIRSYQSYLQRRERATPMSSLGAVFKQCFFATKHFFTNVWSCIMPETSRRRDNLLPLLLLVPFIIFVGWWCQDSDPWASFSQTAYNIIESAGYWSWSILTFPLRAIYFILTQLWTTVYNVAFASLTFLPSFGKANEILYDIFAAQLRLLTSAFDFFMSVGWSIVTVVQMIIAPIFSFKVNHTDQIPDHHISPKEPLARVFEDVQSDAFKALLHAALQKQEESIITKLRADFSSEIAMKGGFDHQLRVKVAYLQDELQRLRRRLTICCRRSGALPPDLFRTKLQEELKKMLFSPEGFVLLGAAVAHGTPSEKTPANVPQFNDTELRVWVNSAFLEKDDFEKALANITKYFNEEFERRSTTMMAASSDEINALMSRQSQIHLEQMAKLKAELSNSNRRQSNYLQSGASSTAPETATSLNEERIRKIISSAIELYDADKTGMADYALESQGGEVVSTRCTETYQLRSPSLTVFGVPVWYPSNSPRTVIQPGMHPGECWAFVGSQGYLVIKLSHRIRIKGFTYEHISPVLLPTGKMDSAPNNFSVYGLRAEGDNDPILLGDYQYLQNGTSMQYFEVQRPNVQTLQLVEIRVKSNHGNIQYTCMYRFRVHGTIA